MFENRRIARATIDAFTAQSSANRNARGMRCIAKALLGCMAILMLLLCASPAGAQGTVAITVTTSPAGLSFSVDGTSYTTQQIFNWNPGDTHTIATTSPQPATSGGKTVPGEVNAFTLWTYNSSLDTSSALSINNYTVPSSDDNVTASFHLEYAVTFESPSAAEGTVSAYTGAASPIYLAPDNGIELIAKPVASSYTSNWQINGSALSPARPWNYYVALISNSTPVPIDAQPIFSPMPTFIVNTNADDDATFDPSTSPGNCTQLSNTATTNTTDNACTLRDAVAAASNVGDAQILFDTTVFKAGNTAAQNTIFLTGDDLEPTGTINIVGPGANILTVDGSNTPNIEGNGIFYIGNSDAPVTISGMTIAHGLATDGGGAIYVDWDDDPGDLTVSNVVFNSNVATYDPGECEDCTSVHSGHRASRARANAHTRAQANANPQTDTIVPYNVNGNSGGAIWNVGNLTVTGCTFSNNSAFSGTTGVIDSGGAIYNLGMMEVTESTFYKNSSDIGGAIDDEADNGPYEVLLARTGSRPARSAAKPDSVGFLMIGNLIQGNTFVDNTSTQLNSGGLSALDSGLSVYNNIFSGNTGAIYNGESGPGKPIDVPRSTVMAARAQMRSRAGNNASTEFSISLGVDVEDNVFFKNLGNEGTPLEDDCTNCTDPFETTSDPMLMTLGNYGGTTPTMLPQPGSSAICWGDPGEPWADYQQLFPTDQRGYPSTNGNYSTPENNVMTLITCLDAGSVQTNYALAFTSEPPDTVYTNLAISPAPAVTLTESGNPTIAGGTVGVTGSTVALGGTVSSSLVKGTASFADITLASATTGETITATLPMNLTPDEPALDLITVSSPFNVVVKSQPSVVASVNTPASFLNNQITLAATVSSTIGTGTPTGTVTFYDGTATLGTGTLTNGVATLNVSTLTAGSHSITVSYAGDANLLSGTSAPITEFIEDFTVSLVSTSATATILPGGTVSFTFNVAPPSGSTFPATINLSLDASDLPTGATYNFSPSSLQAGAGATDITLTVTLPQGLQASTSTGNLLRRTAPFALALLLLPFAGRLRKAGNRFSRLLPGMLLLAASLAAMAGMSGCGATIGYFGQAQHSYTVTVTGTSGALSHSTTITITVE